MANRIIDTGPMIVNNSEHSSISRFSVCRKFPAYRATLCLKNQFSSASEGQIARVPNNRTPYYFIDSALAPMLFLPTIWFWDGEKRL